MINPIYDELISLPCDQNLKQNEPDSLCEIRKLRPDGPRDFQWKPKEKDLLEKLHGAWTGRAYGCALGKPVELIGLARDENGKLNGRKKVKEYLLNRNDFPLRDFFSLKYDNFETCMEHLESELQDMYAVHTINNALVCIIALYYGNMDPILSPQIAVMCGLDTDCNGASVGSITGAIGGRKKYNQSPAEKLNDIIMPAMIGFQKLKMRELVKRSASVRKSL